MRSKIDPSKLISYIVFLYAMIGFVFKVDFEKTIVFLAVATYFMLDSINDRWRK